jgi:hypothetical protein
MASATDKGPALATRADIPLTYGGMTLPALGDLA